MSGFQQYLDNAEARTGITPRAFLALADERGLTGAKAGEIVAWLKAEYDLGHGHAANLAQLITKGGKYVADRYNAGVPLRLDGAAASPLTT
jgi:hypothetical protein